MPPKLVYLPRRLTSVPAFPDKTYKHGNLIFSLKCYITVLLLCRMAPKASVVRRYACTQFPSVAHLFEHGTIVLRANRNLHCF